MSDITKKWKAHQFDWFTMIEQDTEQNFYVCLNQQEMAMILGALTPTLWRTRWINLPIDEDLQWIVELKAKLLCSNGCCDGVETCIRDSEGIREIIREIIREETISDPARPIGGDNPAFDSCPPDVVFGAVTAFVDYLNSTILDALEIIEIATNPLEAINLWADNIQIAGSLASGLVEAIDFILENVAENYDANYTVALRDQYRCDLFCLWIDSSDCDITPAMVANYFAGRIGSPDPLDQLNDILQFIFTGVWSGSQIVDLMHLIAMASLVAADSIGFFDAANAYSFTVAAALGANNPESDWSILCDCTEPTAFARCYYGLNTGNITEFPVIAGIGNGGYPLCTASVNGSNQVVGCLNGIVSGLRVYSAYVRYNIPSNVTNITSVSVNYVTNSITNVPQKAIVQLFNSSNVVVASGGQTAISGTYEWTGDVTTASYIVVFVRAYRNASDGSVVINGVRVEGIADDPFSDGCV